MTFQNHSNFFERSIPGPFADTVNSNFYLSGAVHYTGHCVGSCHAEVVMTVCGKYGIVYAFYIFHQEFNFFAIIPRQAISCCVGDIYHRSAGFDHRFYHARQINIIGTTCIFAVKFNIFHVFFGMFYSSYCPFENFFLGGIKFMFNMKFRSSDTCVYPFIFGILKRFGSHVDVFLHAARQRAYRWPGNCFRDFDYRIKIART